MSTVERPYETSVADFFVEESERCRTSVMEEMQQVAPPGQAELDPVTTGQLRILTAELVAIDGERAGEEYDRYNATKERGLNLPEAELHEWLNGKNILVTGGTGLIGSTLLGELANYNPGRMASVSRGTMQPVEAVAAVEYHYADVRDRDALQAVMDEVKPDIVFHVAADKYNHEAEKRARHTLTTNINGTENVISAANASSVSQIVYASTGKATRPFSPDVYASSKKAGEWMMSEAARSTDMTCSAVRFTHVVDHSNVRHQILTAMTEKRTITIQDPEVLMYVQSARESAHLLMNSGLESHLQADNGQLKIHAIRALGMPINLPDLAIGALARHGGESAVYFTGVRPGYEDKAWFGLYDPMTGGEVSPLINSIEASDVQPSVTCEDVDVFPLDVMTSEALIERLRELQQACANLDDNGNLRELNQQLGWAMLDGRLQALSTPVLARAGKRIEKMRERGIVMSPEHERLNDTMLEALKAPGR